MKDKADVIDSFFRDFKSECDGFFKAKQEWLNWLKQEASNEENHMR